MTFLFYLSLAATTLAATRAASSHPSFTDSQVAKIRANAISASKESWEYGTVLEALTQLDAPKLSVFGATSLPVKPSAGSLPKDAIRILDQILAERPANVKAFMPNGAAADPASIGPAAIVAGITTGNESYSDAAASQLDWMLHHVPRDEKNISVSHRQEQFQAWSDYCFMAPPFFGAAAAATGGKEGAGLMWFAHAQFQGYRDILQDPETKLWRHIMDGNWQDRGLWATGNGWVAMGALRLEATIAKSEYADNMRSEMADLRQWTNEILNATWSRQERSGAVRNYMDRDTFEDSAGTALLAAASYRYSYITRTTDYIPFAEKAFRRLIELLDKAGWVKDPVDPYNFKDVGYHSPEAQSFLLMLHVSSQQYYRWEQSPGRVLGAALLQGIGLTQAD